MPRILVVDTEASATDEITSALRADGASVSVASNRDTAMRALDAEQYDLVIIDTAPVTVGGVEAIRTIRERSDVPIIVASSAADLEERLAGFDMGADDFVEKPLQVSELVRRVRALLRRSVDQTRFREELRGPSGLTLRVRSREVLAGEEHLHLTPIEFSILHTLLERRGEVVTPDDLSTTIWGHETFGSRNFVEAHISRLRSKLRRAGLENVVQTVRGVGYVIR